MKNFLILFTLMFLTMASTLFGADCSSKDQSQKMCKNQGYCTSFPLGKENEPCPSQWTIPENWTATALDCLSNTERKGVYSCEKGGKIKVTICGKSNCYQCICN